MRRLPSFLLIPLLLTAAPAPTSPQPDAPPNPAAPLAATVKKHSLNLTHSAADYLDLTNAYLDFCRRLEKEKQPAPELTVRDGLAAVDAGEAANKKLADWPKLRAELEAFLKKPEPPPEQNQDQQKQDQQNKDQQKQDQKQDKSDPSSSQKNQSKSDQPQDQKQDQQSDPSQQPSENSSSSKDPNSAQPPKDPAQNQQPQEAAFGDMKQPEKPADAQQSAQPSDQPPEQPEMQQVGGAPQNGSTQPTDPNLIGPLQKLDEIRQKDSPAQLQQLLQGPAKPQPPGKNW